MCKTIKDLETVVAVGLNCLENNIDTKETIYNSIMEAAGELLKINPKNKSELCVSTMRLLREEFGLAFEVRNGELVGIILGGVK